MNPLQVKISFNQEIRRFSVPSRNFEQLFESCLNLFKLPFEKKSNLCLRYRDTDGDFVSFSSQEELDEACSMGTNPLFIEIVWVTPKQQQEEGESSSSSSSSCLFASSHSLAGISVPMQEGDDDQEEYVINNSDQPCLFSGQENQQYGSDRVAFFSKKRELKMSKKALKQQLCLLKMQKKQAWKEFKAQPSPNQESKLAWKSKKAELKVAKQVLLQQLLVLAEQNASLKAERKGKSLVFKNQDSEICSDKVTKVDLKNQIICLKKQLLEQKKTLSSLNEEDESFESKRKEAKETIDDLKKQILHLKQQKRHLKKSRFHAHHRHRGAHHGPYPFAHHGLRGFAHHGPRGFAHEGPYPFAHDGSHPFAHHGPRGFAHHGPHPFAHDDPRGFAHHGPHPFAHHGPYPFAHHGPHGFGKADLKEKLLGLKLKKQELKTNIRALRNDSSSSVEEKNDLMMKLFCVKKEMWTLKCQFKKAHKFGRKCHKKAFLQAHPFAHGQGFHNIGQMEQGRPSCF